MAGIVNGHSPFGLALLSVACWKNCVLERGGCVGCVSPLTALSRPLAEATSVAASGAQEVSVMEPHSPLGELSGKRNRVVSCMTPSATSAWPSGSDVSETRSRTS